MGVNDVFMMSSLTGAAFRSRRTLKDAARPDKSANSDGIYRRGRYSIEALGEQGSVGGSMHLGCPFSAADDWPSVRCAPAETPLCGSRRLSDGSLADDISACLNPRRQFPVSAADMTPPKISQRSPCSRTVRM